MTNHGQDNFFLNVHSQTMQIPLSSLLHACSRSSSPSFCRKNQKKCMLKAVCKLFGNMQMKLLQRHSVSYKAVQVIADRYETETRIENLQGVY